MAFLYILYRKQLILFIYIIYINKTRFIDGEGTFHIGINKNKTMKLGYQVILEFVITQHKKDYHLMVKIKDFFNCGYLIKDGPDKYQYRIRALDQLSNNLYPLLDQYPLQTIKGLDAKAFREVHKLMLNNEHLSFRPCKTRS